LEVVKQVPSRGIEEAQPKVLKEAPSEVLKEVLQWSNRRLH